MYIDGTTVVTVASILGAIVTIITLFFKCFKWFQAQEKQSYEIEELRKKEAADINSVKEELCLTTYALLACLSGLKQLNCNGPVTEAYNRLQKHLNEQAHHFKDNDA